MIRNGFFRSAATYSVAFGPYVIDLLVLLGGARMIQHIPQIF
jgi:hypothetical protein